MEQVFQAKVSYGLLGFVTVLFFGPLTLTFDSNGLDWNFILIMMILCNAYAFALCLFIGTRYSISSDKLFIKSSFILNQVIEVAEIREIKKIKIILSAPAPSLDRISIQHGKYDEVVISPRKKKEFVKALQRINPKIQVNLEGLENN